VQTERKDRALLRWATWRYITLTGDLDKVHAALALNRHRIIDGPAAALPTRYQFAGELHILLPGTFVPAVGQQFTILTAGTRSGEFAAILGPSQFGVTYGSNNVVLTLLAPLGDRDGDVDLEDFRRMQLGYAGS